MNPAWRPSLSSPRDASCQLGHVQVVINRWYPGNSYRTEVEHFEVTWGGFLPATGDSIVRYLAQYADQHAISTLKQRLAALAQWHITQRFPDPTKTPNVRQMIRGIRTLHPAQEKQAAPLLLQHLEQAVGWLEQQAAFAAEQNDFKTVMRHRRDRAGTCRSSTPRQK